MEILGKLLLQFGWPSFISFILIAFVAHLAVQWVSGMKFKNAAEKGGIKLGTESDLRYHILFSTAKYRLSVEIPNLEVFKDKPIRQLLMIDLLRIYTKTISDGCRDIATLDMKGWSSDRWIVEMTNHISTIMSAAYETSKSEGIPDIVIIKFARWINPTVEMLFTYIETIGKSSTYFTNLARTNTLFLVVNLLLETILWDAERTIKYLNGDISGKTYKNYIIEGNPH